MRNTHNVRIQNLRHFTVQIRHARTDVTVGTGFIVSMTGQIVTCVHVVRDASELGEVLEGVEVGVYFPQARDAQMKAQKARVACCFQDYDDDVVVLQLDTSSLPDGVGVAILGTAAESTGNQFRSFGYRRLANYQGLPAEGRIIDFAECPFDRVLHSDPIMLNSQHIDSGMSGGSVLDVVRNLVIGVIAETWDSGESEKDRDTSFAVDCRVLTFEPMHLSLQDMPLSQSTVPQSQMDIAVTGGQTVPNSEINLMNAPPLLEEWVGREEFLTTLNQDWNNPQRFVTGLIGFGGEGKSSLARRWVDNLRQDASLSQPDGVFWWGFDEKRNTDEFFEAALTFLIKGIDSSALPSANTKAHVIRAMLKSGRYLFVLDGLEVLQHQQGDDYGLLINHNLREFLVAFAGGGHESFCLITSRAPVLDLIDYITYNHLDVENLSPHEGRDLLRNLGVKGSDAALDKVIADWNGYALVLSLLAAYLVDVYGGDVKHIRNIPPPTDKEPRYEQVQRVLRQYDGYLKEAEREFLTVFSAFRLPVLELVAFRVVFQGKKSGPPVVPSPPPRPTVLDRLLRLVQRLIERLSPSQRRASVRLRKKLNVPVADLENRTFSAMVRQLMNYRILRCNPQSNYYTMHPLIRAHYLRRLAEGNQKQAKAIHGRIADYYRSITRPVPEYPKQEDLAFLIEAVHHLCQAGNYDEAFDICWERIYQRGRFVIYKKLGAYDTALALMLEFFPDGDTFQEPLVSNLRNKSFILNEVGLCLMNLGRMSEAKMLYERSNAINLSQEDWYNASRGYQNLSELYAQLGQLSTSAEAARQALALACRGEHKDYEYNSQAYQGWAAHLQGDLQAAGAVFRQAEALQRKIQPDKRYLYSNRGVFHANHLRRVGNADYARRVAEANLVIGQQDPVLRSISQYHRTLGDLDTDAVNPNSAHEHYNEALKIARNISDRAVLIEALLARGRWAARRGEVDAARNDLEEALNYAVTGGYRIYEADIRVALGWMHLAASNPSAAQQEAQKALRMSAEMGYHWGQADAAEVLKALSGSPIGKRN